MTSLTFHTTKILTPLIIEKFNLEFITQVPKITQIQLSATSKTTINNQINLFNLLLILELISLQKALIIKAKQSVASFKLKKNTALGGKITLTGSSIYKLINKLTLVNLSCLLTNRFTQRVGISANLAIKELNQFSEIAIKANKLKTIYGLTLTILVKNNLGPDTRGISTTFLLNGLQMPQIK